MTKLRTKIDMKVAVNPRTGGVLSGFGNHASFVDKGYDAHVRAIIFPSRKRVYFRFYKPDGDFFFVSDDDKIKSFDVCFTAWSILQAKGYVRKSWIPLFAETDTIVTSDDVRI